MNTIKSVIAKLKEWWQSDFMRLTVKVPMKVLLLACVAVIILTLALIASRRAEPVVRYALFGPTSAPAPVTSDMFDAYVADYKRDMQALRNARCSAPVAPRPAAAPKPSVSLRKPVEGTGLK